MEPLRGAPRPGASIEPSVGSGVLQIPAQSRHAHDPTLDRLFRWTSDGGMVGLGDLPGGSFFSRAFAASADGSVVVGVSDSGPLAEDDEAFRWTSTGGMVGLGDLLGGGFSSAALDTSADGSVVAGISGSTQGGR